MTSKGTLIILDDPYQVYDKDTFNNIRKWYAKLKLGEHTMNKAVGQPETGMETTLDITLGKLTALERIVAEVAAGTDILASRLVPHDIPLPSDEDSAVRVTYPFFVELNLRLDSMQDILERQASVLKDLTSQI